MAIRGIGIDIVHIPRIEVALARWGDRFRKRIFTEREISLAKSRSKEARFLALRFAAKEAFAKALGTGMRSPLRWQGIEILPDSMGRPEISLSDSIKKFCNSLNVHRWHVSLSDDGDHAIAFVVLEGE